MDERDELVKDFLIESFEYLDSLDEDLLLLEKDASDPELLARIFRALHTIKGTGGFLDFDNLVGIAHAGEGLLDCLRKGTVEADERVVSNLFDLVDAVREVLKSIETTGKDGESSYSDLVASLKSLQAGGSAPPPPPPKPAPTKPEPAAVAEEEEDENGVNGFVNQMLKLFDGIEKDLDDFQLHPLDSEHINHILKSCKRIVGPSTIMGCRKLISVVISIKETLDDLLNGETVASSEMLTSLKAHVDAAKEILSIYKRSESEGSDEYKALVDRFLAERQKKEAEAAEAKAKEEATKNAGKDEAADKKTPAGGKDAHKRSLADNNIRVSVDLLDTLMNLVGELVLTRNQILQFPTNETNPAFANSTQNLNLITTELQEGVMKTRMQTIGTIWKKFPRVVRDLAKLTQKKARVHMEGEDTELDKTIIEAIKDPLTHLIRNSVDHGFEKPEDRVRAGKDEVGNLWLRAFHEGGHVNIEISDDGAGIDPEKIKAKALRNGVISQAEATRMSDREILNLIFVSGLSTAKQVSNISGRGVGMDVVKTYIERIGGSVDVNSKLGSGTTIKIKIPLTLAIIPALIIKVCGERFALPQVNLLELVRLEGDQIQTGIEMIHNTPVHRLRGKLLPLVYLDKELGLRTNPVRPEDEAMEASAQGENKEELAVLNIVVLQAEDHPFGLVVNEVVDTGEVVVKPMSKMLKQLSTYAGATIMGDGKIALILDVVGLAKQGGVMSKHEHVLSKSDNYYTGDSAKLTTLLLARVNQSRQIAIPLSMISRLEEIEANAIERTQLQEIVQYRGGLMPIIRLTEILGLPASTSDAAFLQVIVCSKNGVNIGLVVEEILDIVEEEAEMKERTGIVKNVIIIQDNATELMSVTEILNHIDIGVFEKSNAALLIESET